MKIGTARSVTRAITPSEPIPTRAAASASGSSSPISTDLARRRSRAAWPPPARRCCGSARPCRGWPSRWRRPASGGRCRPGSPSPARLGERLPSSCRVMPASTVTRPLEVSASSTRSMPPRSSISPSVHAQSVNEWPRAHRPHGHARPPRPSRPARPARASEAGRSIRSGRSAARAPSWSRAGHLPALYPAPLAGAELPRGALRRGLDLLGLAGPVRLGVRRSVAQVGLGVERRGAARPPRSPPGDRCGPRGRRRRRRPRGWCASSAPRPRT